MTVLQRLEQIDDTIQDNTEKLAKKTKKYFQDTITEYEAALSKEIIKWKRTNAQVQQNQEHISHWMSQFSDTN